MIYNCASHIGKVRKNNEDYCKGEIIDTDFGSVGIFALADGMGGHNKGEVAQPKEPYTSPCSFVVTSSPVMVKASCSIRPSA